MFFILRTVTDLGDGNNDINNGEIIVYEDGSELEDADQDDIALNMNDYNENKNSVVVYSNVNPKSTPHNTYVKMDDLKKYIDNKKAKAGVFKEEHSVTYCFPFCENIRMYLDIYICLLLYLNIHNKMLKNISIIIF